MDEYLHNQANDNVLSRGGTTKRPADILKIKINPSVHQLDRTPLWAIKWQQRSTKFQHTHYTLAQLSGAGHKVEDRRLSQIYDHHVHPVALSASPTWGQSQPHMTNHGGYGDGVTTSAALYNEVI